MKKLLTLISAVLCLASCSTYRGGTNTNNAYLAPNTVVNSFNEYEMEISPDPITYTIDISTPEGKMMLNKLSLKQAQEKVLTEAIIANKCAMIVNPQYSNLMKGKRVLRITVAGFPAKYKSSSKQYVPMDNRSSKTINVNVDRNVNINQK